MSRAFIKRQENFICGHCAAAVAGDGYTNHCPRCLYSRHADVSPGDRLAECDGLMAPVALRRRHGLEQIVHRCLKCHHVKVNRISPADNLAARSDLLLQSE